MSVRNRSQRSSKCGKNISDKLGRASFLTTFWRHLWSITEDKRPRRPATWNLFVNYFTFHNGKKFAVRSSKLHITLRFLSRKKAENNLVLTKKHLLFPYSEYISEFNFNPIRLLRFCLIGPLEYKYTAWYLYSFWASLVLYEVQLDNNIRNCVYSIPKFIIVNSLTEKELKDSIRTRKSRQNSNIRWCTKIK